MAHLSIAPGDRCDTCFTIGVRISLEIGQAITGTSYSDIIPGPLFKREDRQGKHL